MPCSICKIKGHNAINKKFHPANTAQNNTTTKAKIKTNSKKNEKGKFIVETNTITDMKITIENICEYISLYSDKKIILLRKKEVIQWVFGDLSYLPSIEKKNKTTDEAKYKVLEDKWGQDILKTRRPDLKLDKQWTNKFGEHLCEEIFTLIGKQCTKPIKKEHLQPDYEIDDAIIEAKAGTYHTSGTAGEKILGCPFKYADIPDLYSKPLKIFCIGGAERVCRDQYGNLTGAKCSIQKKRFLDFFKENKIEYIGATDILKSLVS